MSRNPLQTRLISIVEPVLVAAGFELVDVRFLLEQIGWVLRVQISAPLADPTADPVDLGDCENMSRELSAVLDVEDPIPQAYSLEVSSPGIDRALRTDSHFAHFTGSEAKITLGIPLQLLAGERRNFKGILRGVTDGRVAIECDGQTFELLIADIDHAKLVPNWDDVMRKPKTEVDKPNKRKHDRG
jgi:ribosome maturation factor RimP